MTKSTHNPERTCAIDLQSLAKDQPRHIPAQAPSKKASKADFESNSLASGIRSLVKSTTQLQQLARGLADIISAETQCLAVWFGQFDPESGSVNIHPISDDNATAVQQLAGDSLGQLVSASFQTGDVCVAQLNANHSVIAAPIATGEHYTMAIAGCFLETNQSSLRQQWMMTLASQAIEKWLQQTELQRTAQHAKAIGDALALCGVLDRTSSTTEAATCLVNHLRRMLSATQVVFCEGKSAQQGKLIAISEVEQFDVHSESSKVILAAAAQGIGKEDPVALTASTRPDPAVAIPLEAYCKANRFASCITIGVTDHDGSPTGSLLIASDCETFSDPQLAQLKQFATVNGAHLEVIRRANLGLVESVIDRVKSVPRKKWFRNALIAIGIAFAILCVPTPYRVHCDCEIQPAIRRFVAVPYTGPLEKTLVEPGEVVSKGQILARMDGQQLRHELTGVKAEFNGAKRRRDSALAQGEVAQSQIARSEMNQLESRLDSLRDQLSRLEIRSPYDGIVISGDLQKAEGASMEIGQTLFEVAPLENMLAEVAIPESEIQYVSDSNSVAIKLNAFPFQTFTGKIRTVHPSAEVINDDSVFVAEVDLSDVDVPIRPGMKGAAKVNTSWRPLGWNLFHNAWESVRCWTVW